uniref:Uncharacterized protein n=1 Tax=Ananas comosus var. bracteatus TaxID=296719 RepID=A0A6V7QEN0_ANACO|nr:unnamed protein product [Ananas comosus var. bracteatus]
MRCTDHGLCNNYGLFFGTQKTREAAFDTIQPNPVSGNGFRFPLVRSRLLSDDLADRSGIFATVLPGGPRGVVVVVVVGGGGGGAGEEEATGDTEGGGGGGAAAERAAADRGGGGGTAAGCAAVCCCCPCAVVDLVVTAVVRLPAGLCRRAMRARAARRRRARAPGLLAAAPERRGGGDAAAAAEKDGVEFYLHLHQAEAATGAEEEASETEKEMWKRFYGAGFWRSPSQVEDER